MAGNSFLNMPPKRKAPSRKPAAKRAASYGKRATYTRSSYSRMPYRYDSRGTRGIDGGSRTSRSYGALDPSVRVLGNPAKFLIAHINPFHEAAYGVRVPDRSTAPSTHLYTFDVNQMAVNATSQASATIYYPNIRSVSVVMTPGTSTTWLPAAAFAGNQNTNRLAGITSNYEVMRPVAHGIRLSSPLSVTQAIGFVHICLFSESIYNKGTWDVPSSISQMTTLPDYQRIPLSKLTETSLIVVNKFLSEGAFQYRSVDDNSHAVGQIVANLPSVPQGFMAICVVIEGGPPSSNALSAEMITHYEAQPTYSTQAPSTTQNAEPANTPAMDACANGSSGQSSFEDTAEGLSERASAFAASAVVNGAQAGVQRAMMGAAAAALGVGIRRVQSSGVETVNQIGFGSGK